MATDDTTHRAYYDAFRKRLVAIREELGWTQERMSELLGVTLDSYKKYETKYKFPPHLLDKLAGVTHRSLDFIVSGRGHNISTLQKRRAG
jgi:transcriptional regulator with XRE-family HTH domain